MPVNDTEILQATLDKDSLSISLVGHADEFNRFVEPVVELVVELGSQSPQEWEVRCPVLPCHAQELSW